MKITTFVEESGNVVVKIFGDLVASNAEQLVEAVSCLEQGGDKRIFLDLAGVPFVDSSGLKTCMQLQNQLRAGGGGLCCFNGDPSVLKVFRVTGADQRIPVLHSTTRQPDFTQAETGQRNRFVLTLVPIFEEVDIARQIATEICREYYVGAGFQELIGDFLLAITEAMNNVVEHGKASQIDVELTALPDQVVYVIRSDGQPFDPTQDVAMPEMGGGEDLPEGGFGRALILELLDEVRYEFKEGKNVLRMTKKIVS
ncbi:MAG: STAS domain-containing protein [Desulfobulbaceae bacterium]|nr:STAS domain-containing protein [Desulfobulbaceae bacterium]